MDLSQPEVASVPGKSTFNVLLQSAKEVTLPERLEERKMDKLYNDIIDWLASKQIVWKKALADTAGCKLPITNDGCVVVC